MARPGPDPTAVDRTPPAPSRRRWLAVVVGLVAVALAGAHWSGYRVNLTDEHVAPPTAAASPDEVVATYVEAYNHRDFATMRTIYPSQVPARHRVLGTMTHVVVESSRALSGPEDGNPAEPGRAYHSVRIGFDLVGMDDPDSALGSGPNGWAYLLERDSAGQPWTIADRGNP